MAILRWAMGSIVRLGELLGCPRLLVYSDPKLLFTCRDEIKRTLAEHLKTQSTRHWLTILEPADVWCSNVYNWRELF